ncbi:hypothetical protein NT2_01_05930 [Caenibius tardaugens NBRC 16725]|uniref:Uncharacterized protein n=1 Tax=Caenibius tardaugens NBRC 16725 TaxID=1219035 RepID=U2ZR46_9SPHN|nr:hypothetical protein [Caenibius tardaugens]AZI36966.1 hypothetical protein EGO55_14180 [Caenibius tardaugens NBRC 16725]GAD47819.1 hypothetical protein NT2_01_05930 [Caenibius tardaugens NBRC 16725]
MTIALNGTVRQSAGNKVMIAKTVAAIVDGNGATIRRSHLDTAVITELTRVRVPLRTVATGR